MIVLAVLILEHLSVIVLGVWLMRHNLSLFLYHLLLRYFSSVRFMLLSSKTVPSDCPGGPYFSSVVLSSLPPSGWKE